MDKLYVLEVYPKQEEVDKWLQGDTKLFCWFGRVKDFSKPLYQGGKNIGLTNDLVDAIIYKTTKPLNSRKKFVEDCNFIDKVEIKEVEIKVKS